MKPAIYLGAAIAALSIGGCIQTLPDGSVVAAPQTATLVGSPTSGFFEGDGPPPQHVVQYAANGRAIAADPDIHIRAALRRDRCQTVVVEQSCADGGGSGPAAP